MNEIIKTADVCRKFCISKSTATRWIRTQGFPAPRKIGKAFFFDADEIEEWWERKGREGLKVYQPE